MLFLATTYDLFSIQLICPLLFSSFAFSPPFFFFSSLLGQSTFAQCGKLIPVLGGGHIMEKLLFCLYSFFQLVILLPLIA